MSFSFFFFFSSRRRHTRCSRDWSSDVCSSDLAARVCDPAQRSLSPPESEAIPCIAGHLRPLHREVLRSFDLTAYEVRLAQERCEPAARVAGSELPQLLDGPLEQWDRPRRVSLLEIGEPQRARRRREIHWVT